MRKQLVIFDLDGTLLDTVADLANATNRALEHCGYPVHPVDAYYKFVGNGINKLFARALPEDSSNEPISKIFPACLICQIWSCLNYPERISYQVWHF